MLTGFVGIRSATPYAIMLVAVGDFAIALTLDVYSHVLPNMQKEATEQLEAMIFRKNGTF